MAYYSTHGFSQFLLNNEKQRVRFLLAHPILYRFRDNARYWSKKPVFILFPFNLYDPKNAFEFLFNCPCLVRTYWRNIQPSE